MGEAKSLNAGFMSGAPGLRVVLRFVGGKARRTQIGVALFRDAKECI